MASVPDVTLSIVDRSGTTYVQATADDAEPFAWYTATWRVNGTFLEPARFQVGEFGIFDISYLPLPGDVVELWVGIPSGTVTLPE